MKPKFAAPQIGHPLVTIGYLGATLVHIRVTLCQWGYKDSQSVNDPSALNKHRSKSDKKVASPVSI